MEEILKVEGLNVKFHSRKITKQVLFNVGFTMEKGQTVGLVGESGSGKSTIAKSILNLIPYEGSITLSEDAKPRMIFQDPAGSLDPSKKVGYLFEEALYLDGVTDRAERQKRSADMIKTVGLTEEYLGRYPRELSGGQKQRVCIGLSLMQNPGLLIADEPVSALDVTIQAQILALMEEIQNSMGLSILFISHDLRVVYNMCDSVMILKDGRIVEQGPTKQIYKNPSHDYTKLLLSSIA